MKHSQDKGTAVGRAMRGTIQGDAAEAVRQRRLMDTRDYSSEVKANERYEELRLLTKEQLYPIAGLPSPKGRPRGAVLSFSRQQLIALIIEQER